MAHGPETGGVKGKNALNEIAHGALQTGGEVFEGLADLGFGGLTKLTNGPIESGSVVMKIGHGADSETKLSGGGGGGHSGDGGHSSGGHAKPH